MHLHSPKLKRKPHFLKNERVSSLDIKKSYLLAHQLGLQINQKPNTNDFQFWKMRERIYRNINKLSNEEIDFNIKDPVRIERYESLVWHKDQVALANLGVWPKMTSIDIKYCTGSVIDTAKKMETDLCTNDYDLIPILARNKLKGIQNNLRFIRDNFPLIVIPSGEIREYDYVRFGDSLECNLLSYDVEDGSNRSVAYALKGFSTAPAFIGSYK